MESLVEYGCDAAQGYFFSRPLPGDDLVQWFESSPFGTAPDLACAPPPVDTPPALSRSSS
jgi:hypothetical protein